MKRELIPVEGERNLFRDPRTNAIINNNSSDYISYIKRKDARLASDCRIQEIEDNISSLKNDIGEIKELLRGILNGPKWYWFRKSK